MTPSTFQTVPCLSLHLNSQSRFPRPSRVGPVWLCEFFLVSFIECIPSATRRLFSPNMPSPSLFLELLVLGQALCARLIDGEVGFSVASSFMRAIISCSHSLLPPLQPHKLLLATWHPFLSQGHFSKLVPVCQVNISLAENRSVCSWFVCPSLPPDFA